MNEKMHAKKKHVFFIFFCFCFFGSLDAVCCYAILLGDTFSPTGRIAFSELQESSNALAELCIASDMSYHETLLLGDEGIEGLNTAMDAINDSISPLSEDLVFFLFLGHGYRQVSECSPWPTLFFFHTGESLPMQMLLDRLSKIPTRFLCVLADCCNNPITCKMTLSPFRKPRVNHSQLLFNVGKGKFILAAAEAGSVAYCTDQRHCCTAALWKALNEESRQVNPTWEEIGQRVIQLLSPLQTPYYVLDVDSKKTVCAHTF